MINTRQRWRSICLIVAGACLPLLLRAQSTVAVNGAPASREPDSTSRKSPGTAVVLGSLVPGAGHWYAGEAGRGWIILAVNFAGFAISREGGRTDAVGKLGGLMIIGAFGVSMIDGAAAARRYNARLPNASVRGADGRVELRLTVARF